LLHTFSKFDSELLKQCAQPLLKGLSDCCKGSVGLRSELSSSPDFWAILHQLHDVPEAAGDVFQLVEELTTSPQPSITADNYEPAIALLNKFGTAAQIGAVEEQKHDLAVRRGKAPAKSKKPEYVDHVVVRCLLISSRSNEIVVRGRQAMIIVYELSSRVPKFIESSHLEASEGKMNNSLNRSWLIKNSIYDILVANT
jgi:brefeldin A-resistance guanine nucleotide exchange factor 1